MHEDEHRIAVDQASALVRNQFPQWRDLPIEVVLGPGTVNSIFRVGVDVALRFPLQGADPESIRDDLEKEAVAMGELAACCPFPTPVPLGIGSPGRGFPLPWSVQTWIDGDVATPRRPGHSHDFAHDLAQLVTTLRSADTLGRCFTGSGRGGTLADHDDWMATCLDESVGLLDVPTLSLLWEDFRQLPPAQHDVMSHTDLTPPNLLVRGNRLVGVLDGGGFSPADPALDLIAAWHLLETDTRREFRHIIGCADVEWARGMAWAFEQSMGLVWYYRESNRVMCDLGLSTLDRIVDASRGDI